MSFESILKPSKSADNVTEPTADSLAPVPDCFHDLYLDQVMASLTAGREACRLDWIFCAPIADLTTILYRQNLWSDLEKATIATSLRTFAQQMQHSRKLKQMTAKSYDEWSARRWLLDAVWAYGGAVRTLNEALGQAEPASEALTLLREWLDGHIRSERFRHLIDEGEAISRDLSDIVYAVSVGEGAFTVCRPGDEVDYGADIEETFARFRQGDVGSHRVELRETQTLDHIEAQILEFVSRLNPELFGRLQIFCDMFENYEDTVISRFDRETRFCLAYMDFIAPLREKGLLFSCPVMSETDKTENAEQTFDLALAARVIGDGGTVVTNDFALNGPERIIMVTGPNQGGKTTFARTFGQLHYLARLGLPVPGQNVRLFLVDNIYTHFEREENAQDLRGKLEDELVRIHAVTAGATSRSLVVMNESFNSTTADDAVQLSAAIIKSLIERDLICVCVTFLDEIAGLSKSIVSMVSTVDPNQNDVRTYKVLRRPSDGRVYAASVAHKYQVTGADIRRRLSAAPLEGVVAS